MGRVASIQTQDRAGWFLVAELGRVGDPTLLWAGDSGFFVEARYIAVGRDRLSREVPNKLPLISARIDSPVVAQPPAVMRQVWNHLFFLHWIEQAERLQPLLPRGLTLDYHDGKTYVGIVGFLMDSLRPKGLPAVPWLSYFRELNVRLYVRDHAGRPGVYFLSLDCDRAIAVWIARAFFSLPYRHATMSFGATNEDFTLNCHRWGLNKGQADYAWRPVSIPQTSLPGTLEFHLLERYRFFTQRRGRLHEGRVSHTPYEASKALFSKWSALPFAWNGLPIPNRPPDLAHYCRGVSVEAYPIRPVEASFETPWIG
jgi:uncharacterized protein YqjF (DUF2071 family)